MSAPLLMALATLLFASMGVCVKLASAHYGTGEIVLYRSLIGMAAMVGVARWRGERLGTHRPGMHFWRSATGTFSLVLWFYALSGLPLATAMTLNYMSSVWIALFLLGGTVMLGSDKVDGRLVAAVLTGFAGVALVLRPTLDQQQLWHGLAGLLSGMLSATAYLQVTTLGRAGEPATRIVFYFSMGGAVLGSALTLVTGLHAHTLQSAALLLATGVLATGAQMLMTQAYRVGSTLSNASLQYLGIAYSFGYGALLFNDPVTWMAVAGMLLIVAAGLAATLVRSRTAPKDAQESTTEL